MLKSDRLNLREATKSDSDFILELINQPAWKKYISKHSIKTQEQACTYIEEKLIVMYREHGFGMWVVESTNETSPVGLCGLLKRDSLKFIDLGFGFLPKYWGKGFATEASALCLHYAFERLNTPKVLAITVPCNDRSIRLLENLRFSYKEEYFHPGSSEVLSLYEVDHQVFAEQST